MLAPAAAASGVWDFSPDPALGLIASTALLYRVGCTLTVTPARKRTEQRWRSAAFYTAMVVLALALSSPLDALSEQLFWVHMLQHVLLLMVVPPLLVLSRPWIRLWRSLPLGWRRSLAHSLGSGDRAAPLRAASRTLGGAPASFALFCGVLLVWHVPALFDATLRSEGLHVLEHALFLCTAIMFWKQVIHSPPLRDRMTDVQRVLYLVGAMVVSWVLAIVLALAQHPLYDLYAHRAVRPGGISALADQQLAAGIMWVPGSITFVIVIFACVHRSLMPAAGASGAARKLASEH
jgi:putative membrane protein